MYFASMSTVLFSFQGLDGDLLWASISNKSLNGLTNLLKQCDFKIKGKVT